MTYRPKRLTPAKPTRRAIQAALNAQRPLDQDVVDYRRKKAVRREWDEPMPDMGEKK